MFENQKKRKYGNKRNFYINLHLREPLGQDYRIGTARKMPVDRRHPRSVIAYSVELVLLNKHQISGGGAYLHCYPKD